MHPPDKKCTPWFRGDRMADFPSWQQGLRQAYPCLRGAAHADVAVVGGGLIGVATAFMLQRSGVKTILLEADVLGHGASFGCGGIVTCQAPETFRRIHQVHGIQAAKAYAHLLREATHTVSELARTFPGCRPTPRSVYVYAETQDDLPRLEALLALESRLGLPVSIASDAGGCPFPVELSAVMHHQSTLFPLPLLLGLARSAVEAGCQIYEHSRVLDIQPTQLHTSDGTVHADRTILCTGVPAVCRSVHVLSLMEPRLMEARVLQSPSALHTVQLSVQPDEPALAPMATGLLMTLDRGAFGTHQADDTRIIRDRTLRALLPECTTSDVILRREVYTRDGLPLIGPITPHNARLLMAGGFSAHGLTGAWLAARTLTAFIHGHPLAESELFRPFRRLEHAPLLPVTTTVKRKLRQWRHPNAPHCPHMGCPLRYHSDTKSWQCPCHGSSFDVFGQVLSAPATHNAIISPRDRP